MVDGTCVVDGCDSPINRAKQQMCEKHFSRWRRHGTTEDRKATCLTCGKQWVHVKTGSSPQYCSVDCKPRCPIEGCTDPVRANGWCISHYSRMQHYGDLTLTYRQVSERICIVCGAVPQVGFKYNKFCSNRCHANHHLYDGKRPESVKCGSCGVEIDLTKPLKNGRMPTMQTLLCRPCRKGPKGYALNAAELAERDGADCALCGDLVDFALKAPHAMSPSVDHILPRSKGGSHDAENLQLAHLRCNTRKGNRLVA